MKKILYLFIIVATWCNFSPCKAQSTTPPSSMVTSNNEAMSPNTMQGSNMMPEDMMEGDSLIIYHYKGFTLSNDYFEKEIQRPPFKMMKICVSYPNLWEFGMLADFIRKSLVTPHTARMIFCKDRFPSITNDKRHYFQQNRKSNLNSCKIVNE